MVFGQHACGDGGPAGKVRQIGPDARASRCATNGVAQYAGMGEEDLLAMHGLSVRGSDGALRLSAHPVVEVLLRFGNHVERHVRMLHAAVLRALTAPAARLIDLHQDVGVVAGHEITLALDVRRPEAVDHVARCAVNADRCSNRDVNLIGRGHHAIRLGFVGILHFPPPLMTVDIDGESLLLVHPAKAAAGDEAADQHDEEQDNRESHGAGNRTRGETIALFRGGLWFRHGVERVPSAPHEVDQRGQSEEVHRSSNPEDQTRKCAQCARPPVQPGSATSG